MEPHNYKGIGIAFSFQEGQRLERKHGKVRHLLLVLKLQFYKILQLKGSEVKISITELRVARCWVQYTFRTADVPAPCRCCNSSFSYNCRVSKQEKDTSELNRGSIEEVFPADSKPFICLFAGLFLNVDRIPLLLTSFSIFKPNSVASLGVYSHYLVSCYESLLTCYESASFLCFQGGL